MLRNILLSGRQYFQRASLSTGNAGYNVEKSFNQVTLIGRVGTDPQLRGSEEHPVVLFTVATNIYTKKDDELNAITDWHKISVFNSFLQNALMKHLRKGARVMVQGKIKYGEITNNVGFKYPITSIVAEEIIFLSQKVTEEE